MAKEAAPFGQAIGSGYAVSGDAIELGVGMHDCALVLGASVRLPLRMLNRHRLIAPSPGRGKKAAVATGGGVDALGDFLESSTGRIIQRELVRGLFGLLRRKI